MARPVNADAELTQRNIREAASNLFADHGFEGTSVRQIAQGAGVSLGMIRHYFGSKEGLYRACIASAYEIFGQLGGQIGEGLSMGAAGSPGDTVAEVIGQAVRQGFRYAVANKPAFKLMLWDLMSQASWRTEMGDREMLPFILTSARGMAGPLGRPQAELVMATRSMIFLVVRYATADLNEIAYLLNDGDPTIESSAATLDAVEDHLVEVAKQLLTMAPTS